MRLAGEASEMLGTRSGDVSKREADGCTGAAPVSPPASRGLAV